MSERRRPRFECWKCDRRFHQTVDIRDDPVLLLECPFCGALAKADLAPYRGRTHQILRSDETGFTISELHLPDPIPTQNRK